MDWFMTLFSRMSLKLGMRVFDVFVVESWSIVFKIGMTFMRTCFRRVGSLCAAPGQRRWAGLPCMSVRMWELENFAFHGRRSAVHPPCFLLFS